MWKALNWDWERFKEREGGICLEDSMKVYEGFL